MDHINFNISDNKNTEENITFFFEDTIKTGEDNSIELEKMMQEFELEDNQFVSLNESLNDLSYFIKKNFYSGNDEFYYNEEYKIKDLLKICQYYGIAKNVKASKC